MKESSVQKDEILREIQRTATENGGKPLGRQKFVSVTRIRQSEWLGKYWARWGDAIREARLEPNRLNPAYDHEVLI